MANATFPQHARFVESAIVGSEKLNVAFLIDVGEFPVENARTGAITMKRQFCKVPLDSKTIMTDKDCINYIAAQGLVNLAIPAKAQPQWQRIKPTMQGERLAVFAAARNRLPMPDGLTQEQIDAHLAALDLTADGERVKKEAPKQPDNANVKEMTENTGESQGAAGSEERTENASPLKGNGGKRATAGASR